MTGKRFYPAAVQQLPAGSGFSYLKARNTDSVVTVSCLEARLFSFLRGCVTLAEHSNTVMSLDTPGMNPRWAETLITRWVTSELLLPAERLSLHNPETNPGTAVEAGSGTPVSPNPATVPYEETQHRLSKAGVPPEIIAFAIGTPESAGLARGEEFNRAVLGTPADRIILQGVGDHPRFSALRDTDEEDRSFMTLDGYPPLIQRYSDKEKMNAELKHLPEFSFTETSDRILGMPAGSAACILEDASPELLFRVEIGHDVIRCVTAGRFGAGFTGHPVRLLTSPENYRKPWIVEQMPVGSVHDGRFFTPGVFSLDLNTMVPPFFPPAPVLSPAYREITAALFQITWPPFLTATLPVSVECETDSMRKSPSGLYTLELEDWVSLFLHAFLPVMPRQEGPGCLEDLGRRFVSAGELEESPFRLCLEDIRNRHFTALAAGIESARRSHNEPPGWAAEADAVIEYLNRERNNPLPLSTDTLEHLQRVFCLWGKVLVWWPRLWEAARRV